ncbi:MAG: hypothetical protein ACR2NP_03560 [Pirellulaceae bacterium]
MKHICQKNNSWRAIQLASGLLIAACLLASCGCQTLTWFQPRTPPAPVVFEATPSAEQLVANIESNARSVQQLKSSVKVAMDGLPVSATGTLLMERPQRMRLKVGLLNMTDTGVDIGSNEDRFWVFNKSSVGGQEPAIYFARHADYQNSQLRQSLGLEPQWLFDALGLIEFDDSWQVAGPYMVKGFVELHVTSQGPGGIRKRVMTLHPQSGVILQQAVYDAQNRLLAWAKADKHRYYAEHEATLPQYVELNMVDPQGNNTRLAVQLQSHTINSLYVDPELTWKMPAPSDVPVVDLNQVNAQAVQRVPEIPPGVATATESRRQPYQRPRPQGFDWR